MPRSLINLTTDIDVRGPLLKGRDGPVMRAFFRDAKETVGDAGVERVKARITARAKDHSEGPGDFADAVKVFDFKQGRTIMAEYPQVLRGPWLEGVSERNQTTRFKGYRIFRLTRAWLRKNVGPLIADRLDQAVQELNGGDA